MKYNYNEARWKNNELFIRNRKTGISLVPHEKYQDLYRIKWSDGVIVDFYNKTRAKDNSVKDALDRLNDGRGSNLKGRTEPIRSPLVRLNCK